MLANMALRAALKSTSIVLGEGSVLSKLKGICSALPLNQHNACISSLNTRTENRHLQGIASGSHVIQHVRDYAVRGGRNKKPEFQSQLSDLPPTMLKMEYAGVTLPQTTDDVVKRLLTLELASNKEKMSLKMSQLIAKVRRDELDDNSPEVRIARYTAKIRNLQEHMHKHPKDKAQKRRMLMAIDARKKQLKYLRTLRYDSFEHVCQELGITYTFPPEYYRRMTRRWVAKKALAIKVYQEVQKLKAEQRKKTVLKSKPLVEAPKTKVASS